MHAALGASGGADEAERKPGGATKLSLSRVRVQSSIDLQVQKCNNLATEINDKDSEITTKLLALAGDEALKAEVSSLCTKTMS